MISFFFFFWMDAYVVPFHLSLDKSSSVSQTFKRYSDIGHSQQGYYCFPGLYEFRFYQRFQSEFL